MSSRRCGPAAPAARRTRPATNGAARRRRHRASRRSRPGPVRPRSAPSPRPRGAPIAFPDGADEVLLPMTQMRKGIAAQMTRALAVPHAYVHMEVDATGLVARSRGGQARLPGARGHLAQLRAVRDQGRGRGAPRHPTFNAHWTDDGPRSPSAGSTSASRSRSTTGCSCRSSAMSISSQHQRPQPGHRRRRGACPRRQAPLDDFGGSDVHDRQHRLVRLEPDDADHQRARGRDPDDGGDHQAAGRRRDRPTATSSRSGP